jgi:HlyD family secretion protein
MRYSAALANRNAISLAYAGLTVRVPSNDDASPTPFSQFRELAWTGLALIGVFVVGFGAWSALAPLESAAIAAGVIESESSRKTIQHLEGGIVGEILVKDGDTVSAGQVVIRFDDVKARTQLVALTGQLWDALAREARLLAERDGRDQIKYPDSLTAQSGDPAVQLVITGQTKIFQARRAALDSKIRLITQRIAQVQQEIVGLRAQETASRKRAAILHEEVAGLRHLLNKGIVPKPRVLALEREIVAVDGRQGELLAHIARAQQTIAEAEVSIISLENDTKNEIVQSLRDTQNQIHALVEQIQAAAHVLTRTEVRAPESGVVTDLRIRTPGGVVGGGEPLLDLVPKEDRLIVAAQVRPEDIDLVRPGLPAQIRLIPYRQRRTPPIAGKVIHVSADRLVDQRSGQPYYLARVEADEAVLKRLKEVEMVAGMPTEVMIKTGKTTVALYVLAPILDSFDRAFREN